MLARGARDTRTGSGVTYLRSAMRARRSVTGRYLRPRLRRRAPRLFMKASLGVAATGDPTASAHSS